MANEKKFKRVASRLYWLTGAAIIVLCGLLAWRFVTHPLTPATAADYFDSNFIAPDVTQVQLWAAMSFGLVAFAAFIGTLIAVRRLLDCYRKGEVLTHTCANLIVRIGQGVVLVGGLRILAFSLESAVLSLAAPEGQRSISVGIDSADIGLLLAGGLFVLIGWAMRDAALADAENKGFI